MRNCNRPSSGNGAYHSLRVASRWSRAPLRGHAPSSGNGAYHSLRVGSRWSRAPLRGRARGSALLLYGALAAVSAQAQTVEPAHFHHVHLNVTDPKASIEFYRRAFGAQPIRFRHQVDALYTERSFLLLEQVEQPADSRSDTGIWHIGWGGTDIPNLYESLQERGVEVHTPLYQIPGSRTWVVYWRGPDGEMIETNTMGHHRFAHVHLLAKDVNVTTNWYAQHLGVKPRREQVEKVTDYTKARAWSNGFRCDNVSFVVYGRPDVVPLPAWWNEPPLRRQVSTKGHAVDHVAFSYRDLDAAYARMQQAGVRIVERIAERTAYGMRSFFVEAPDKVLVEIVEAKPIPEGLWD